MWVDFEYLLTAYITFDGWTFNYCRFYAKIWRIDLPFWYRILVSIKKIETFCKVHFILSKSKRLYRQKNSIIFLCQTIYQFYPASEGMNRESNICTARRRKKSYSNFMDQRLGSPIQQQQGEVAQCICSSVKAMRSANPTTQPSRSGTGWSRLPTRLNEYLNFWSMFENAR